MPVSFLTSDQRKHHGRYHGTHSASDLSRFFHLDDADLALIAQKRGDHSRLGFSLQLTTARFLGTFLDDPTDVPEAVLHTVARQLDIVDMGCLSLYQEDLRWKHAAEIRTHYGYRDFSDRLVGFRLARWLSALCWTGTDRPSVLFERAVDWLLAHKVLLPGATPIERFVARVRSRMDARLWRLLGQGITDLQRGSLEALLVMPEGSSNSVLDQLRTGPLRVSGLALVRAIKRLDAIRSLGISLPAASHIPAGRLAAMARFAHTAKLTAITRLSPERRLATLVAFVHCLEATAHDDALEVLEMLLQQLFSNAEKEQKKVRLRTLKDLDQAARTLAEVCKLLLDLTVADIDLRAKVFTQASAEELAKATADVDSLTRPPEDVYFNELDAHYRSVRTYLPTLVSSIRFGATPAAEPVLAALAWFEANKKKRQQTVESAPREVINKSWQRYVVREDGKIDVHAYTFCVLSRLQSALKRRDVFVNPSWRYGDPRAGLLSGSEWEAARPIICRTLGLSSKPGPILQALSEELDQTYRIVAARLPDNPAARFETAADGKRELVLSPLDKLDESPSLLALRAAVTERLPRVELPEILLEIAARTDFIGSFTHVSEAKARATDLGTSLCAVLLAEACNTGYEPLVREDVPALRRERLSWIDQNYIRDETLTAANARLVTAQNQIALAHAWGGGDVASADGMRFVVPVRTVHAGANPKYFGQGRGVTWYNMLSDQFSGLNGIVTPGTLRDSLVLLAVVLEQETELVPTQIMTDTGAYSDIVFGLFRLLGYRFSPRLADIGGTRFWRIDPHADYGEFNALARQRVNTSLIVENWDDMLRLTGSLKLGRVPATGIMRSLQIADRPTRLAQAVAEFGRIDKTLHALTTIDDEEKRRSTLAQLNRGEGRHSLARVVFHGKRGELRQHYREGQEDQLGALGLVLNVIVLWNTIYMDAILAQLRREGFPMRDEDVARLSPLGYSHINMLGRYSFAVPEAVQRGELRPLRGSGDGD
ncbi:MAG: Tn3 family transposase [Pseudobdellovibrionaceae bacterium]|nr:Tn3 family transposase [Pseudobdellovibrionaceae bacterium]